MQLEQQSLEQKCDKLNESCREKERAKQKYHKMYTTLKEQHHAAGIELQADHDAENVLEAAHYNTAKHQTGQPVHSRAGSNGSGRSGGRSNSTTVWQARMQGSRASLPSARESHQLPKFAHFLTARRQRTRCGNSIGSPHSSARTDLRQRRRESCCTRRQRSPRRPLSPCATEHRCKRLWQQQQHGIRRHRHCRQSR